jgi:hypothetical protein
VRRFLRKIRQPPSFESPSKYESASLFFNLQLYNNLDSCGDIHCALRQLKNEEIKGVLLTPLLYHRERILKTSTLSCNEEKEEITKPLSE